MLDLIIIGGGVSGVSCYIEAKRKNPNLKILIIEHNKELLKKLSVTGNGKCNIANSFINDEIYENGDSFSFINEDLCKNTLLFLDYLQVKYTKDLDNRYYPYSMSAKTIIDKMKYLVDKKDYILDSKIKNIIKENEIFKVSLINNQIYESKNLLISCGSNNYKSLGSDGSLFKIIQSFGHSFTKMYPADIWINVKEKDITKELSGIRVNSKLSLFMDDKFIYSESGELLFKDNALSGIVSFNISHRIARLYKNFGDNINLKITVDFIPTVNENDINVSNIKNELFSYLHPQLAKELVKNLDKYSKRIDIMKNFKFSVESLGDINYAQVVCGGVKTDEINYSLESKIIKNLYFSGDIIDVSAPCGGYNLMFAINSGIKVGDEIE